ncbi:MAG: HD domain-containing protein [Acidobacteria bacterium]|nr:HD domain-containing protein [Acidobacteriota bacterium]
MIKIQGWTPDLEKSFKQILFRFLEEVNCTKAALYLLAADGSYLLVTQYGFGRRDALAAEFPPGHPLVLRARELRNEPKALHALEDFPEIAGYLEGAGSGWMLLAPLYGASRLLGFVDARDKGRRQRFVPRDLKTASDITGAMIHLLATLGLYPDLDEEALALEEPAVEKIEPENQYMPRVITLDEPGLQELVGHASSMVRELAAIVSITVIEEGEAASVVFAAGDPDDTELAAIQRHQTQALIERGIMAPPDDAWSRQLRKVGGRPGRSSSQTISSGVLLEVPGWTLLGSAVIDREVQDPRELIAQLAQTAAEAHRCGTLRFLRRRYVQSLVEPYRAGAPDLVQHMESVSRLAWRVAFVLGLDPETTEEAAMAGLVHDIGLTDLIGQPALSASSPGPEERRLYRSHVVSGEKKLVHAGFDELARVVRHHHERWDGGGFPDRLSGDAIPLLSRLVHVAEVYDRLVSEYSYRAPIRPDRAIAILQAAAGRQFDPNMVDAMTRLAETP